MAMPLLRAALLRRFFSSEPPPALPKLPNLCYRHRRAAVPAARAAVFEYLHSTRSLPASHADSIAALSPCSLLSLLASLPAVPSSVRTTSLPRLLRRHLSFHPLNELAFFFESIGLPPSTHSDLMFLADHPSLLGVVAALTYFGFPWSRLGLLFPAVLLHAPPDIISARLSALEGRLSAFPRAAIIAACLSFPSLLENDLSDLGPVVDDLGSVFRGLGPDLGATNDIDVFMRLCRKMQMFYDAGVDTGSVGRLSEGNQRVFEVEEERIAQKLEFFMALGMTREKVGMFLLCNPEVSYLDFGDVLISVPEYLRKVDLPKDEVDATVGKHPYVVGRNRLANLPGVLRALGLDHQFLEKISDGGKNLRYLSPDFVLENYNYDLDVERAFLDGMAKLKAVRIAKYLDSKLEFLKSIGYGENMITTRILASLHSKQDMLHERFDFLLERGMEYTMVCRMVSIFPKLLNQRMEPLTERLNYLTEELGYSLEYLDCFPAFLCFDLENRVKPRHRMLQWLQQHGLLKKPLAPATIVANSESRFIHILYNIHPAASKLWLECFSSRIHMERYLKNMYCLHPNSE